MTNPNCPISIKTLAAKVGGDMTVRRLRLNGARWGTDKARIKTGTRSILFREREALDALKKAGVIS